MVGRRSGGGRGPRLPPRLRPRRPRLRRPRRALPARRRAARRRRRRAPHHPLPLVRSVIT